MKNINLNHDTTCRTRNYYAYLGLKAPSTGSEIKKAYYTLARQYHPDKTSGNKEKEEKFKKIKEGYEVLSKHKSTYDWWLRLNSRQNVSEFECAGCHFKSDKLFYKIVSKDGTEFKFCTYFCLPDCDNSYCSKQEEGKCYPNWVKSKNDGNFCSNDCLNEHRNRKEKYENWEPKEEKCVKCNKLRSNGGEFYNLRNGDFICVVCYNNDNEDETCFFCEQQYQGSGVNFKHDPETVFCSEKCARSWEKGIRNKKNLAEQRDDFITENLEKLSGWNLLSEEEKANFIEQINNSESEQFENILRQAKKLIKEKQALINTQKRASKKNNSSENNTSDHETDSGYDSNQSHESESEELSNLFSLTQSQTQTEQKIEKLLKDSGISDQQLDLDQKELLQGIDWKEYLKKLDTPTKIKEFANQIEQAVLKLKLASKTTPKDQTPKNEWLLPVAILVVSLLALTSLMLIVRRKRQRGRF